MINKGLLRQFNIPAKLHRNLAWGLLMVGALLAFELFNFSSTDFALTDLIGDLSFGGISWATVLALAFCAIDFAGIAHMFSNGNLVKRGLEVWYLLGAWLLAATMNATLTWWGVSIAIIQHGTLGNGLVSREALLKFVPAFVAVLVWLIRVLVIGTLINTGNQIFSRSEMDRNSVPAMRRQAPNQPARRPNPQPASAAIAHSMNGYGNGYSKEDQVAH